MYNKEDFLKDLTLKRIHYEHQQQEDFGLLYEHESNLRILIEAGGPPSEEFANLAMLAVSWVYGEISLRKGNEALELIENGDDESLAQFIEEHTDEIDENNIDYEGL